MSLPSTMIYNDLTGEDCKQILLIRFADLLNQVKEFVPHLTLPRVRMLLDVHLEITGRTPPTISISDDLIVRMRDSAQPMLPGVVETESEVSLQAEVNADTTTSAGQPPDQIREEHGLPVMVQKKGPFGTEDVPVIREDRVRYAFNVTQDYGPMRQRTGNETPVVGADAISQKNSGGGSPDVAPDMSKVHDPNYEDKYDPLDVNYRR